MLRFLVVVPPAEDVEIFLLLACRLGGFADSPLFVQSLCLLYSMFEGELSRLLVESCGYLWVSIVYFKILASAVSSVANGPPVVSGIRPERIPPEVIVSL